MENYKVYKHTFPNQKVYIGITKMKPEYRWGHKGNGYYQHPFLMNAIQKYGWQNINHEILFDNLTKQEAEQKEIELIRYYKSNNRKFGYNIANGGFGSLKWDKATLLKISNSKSGKKVSEETRKKQSQSLKGIPKTESWKRKIGLGNKGKVMKQKQKDIISKIHSKAILCIELNKVFKNVKEAAEYFGHFNRGTNIQNVVNNQNRTAYGYHWRYEKC